MAMTIASREGTDPYGNRWKETIVRTGDDSFRLEVRSDDPEDCFDTNMNLKKVFEYTRKTAVQPFVWTLIRSER